MGNLTDETFGRIHRHPPGAKHFLELGRHPDTFVKVQYIALRVVQEKGNPIRAQSALRNLEQKIELCARIKHAIECQSNIIQQRKLLGTLEGIFDEA